MERFPVGVLYPVVQGAQGADPEMEDDDQEDDGPIEEDKPASQTAEPLTRRRLYIPPSSVGFSFFIRGETIKLQISCKAVQYKMESACNATWQSKPRGSCTDVRCVREQANIAGKEPPDGKDSFVNRWHRAFLPDKDGEEIHLFSAPEVRNAPSSQRPIRRVLQCHAGIEVLWRPFADGWVTTVSLFNKKGWPSCGDPQDIVREKNENALFEVALRCIIDAGEVGAYPRVDPHLLSEEEQELELRYRTHHIYAVGHGAAVNWATRGEKTGERVREIWTEFLPAVEVPQVTADVSHRKDNALRIARLASANASQAGILDALDDFVEGYAAWFEDQERRSASLPPDDRVIARRIVDRIGLAVSRMKQGVRLLREDQRAMQAFIVANQAMLDQMVQSDLIRETIRSRESYRWRPFQLAFLLSVLESAVHEESDFRDTVDLIWFPTGGGKTEAYLGLIAFLVVWRRLTYPASGGGTTALMRYTLRLLTAQQYVRATRLICALERIRQQTPALGKESITIGLWVGRAAAPNTLWDAKKCIQKAADGSGKAPMELALIACPWCGAPFRAPDNYVITNTDFSFRCTQPACPFGQASGGFVPCQVVDEVLYAKPPTVLIATIDKFARLAWEERTTAFFGSNGNRPPELVIQDELHLIAGELGSVAGLYEAALDTVLIRRGVHPKYIASTATIRNANQQANRLYGRKAVVFPPPGLSCDDSYFARTVPLDEKPGRLYVGYLAPMLGRQAVGKTPSSIVPLAAALLLAPSVISSFRNDREVLLDAWWTQVVYHGSLKGVGTSHNAFNNEVRDYLRRYCGEWNELIRRNPGAGEAVEPRSIRIAQLTSLSNAEDNARTFASLERTHVDPDYLDVVLATNMISAGLDVARLALMIINGQPLTTAEYIQASSRVGRGDTPGVVFAHYYRDQARSLSHYEHFRPYHESFYRFVEPTSVTPYTYQARTRALHAALVIAIRHSCGSLLANGKAGGFDPTGEPVAQTIEILKNRCRQADPERAALTARHLDKLVQEWKAEVDACRAMKRQLNYQAPNNDKVADRLLYNHDDPITGCWATLQSMRHVEHSALLEPT